MKKVNLIFITAGKSDLTVTLEGPKDGLTLEECRQAAEKMKDILLTRSGVEVTGFKKATLSETTETDLE